ncbi:hypothetical protein ACQPZK_22415 [Micromonospora sp. CA-249363]|uniref:hypothetical protein n=1 Tax=Micromonospora sp. CA-249363 TaxID=3239963 RepID=UPI003D948C1C
MTVHRNRSNEGGHVPMRPLWLCHRCGQPWPCGSAKLALVAEYRDVSLSLFLYLAGCLHEAIDDLHRLNPTVTGTAADLFDRFLGWPVRHRRLSSAEPQTPEGT